MTTTPDQLIAWGLDVIELESQAISNLASNLDEQFAQACQLLLSCKGHVIVTGLGKSGHIGRKLAATLASTGTPAFFIHASEALHGDLGMITNKDVVISLSNSGTTEELVAILPLFKNLGIPVISMVGNLSSPLAKASTICLNIQVEKEACALGLAPTASTSATLAMGDALAMAILQARKFTKEDFARSHPGGKLGRQLLVRVADIMHSGPDLPKVSDGASLTDAILEMSSKRLGMTTIVKRANPNQMIGIFTDGDLRRSVEKGLDLQTISINEVMTQKFVSILPTQMAAEAVTILEQYKITGLPVRDEIGNLVGAFNLHDLFKAGVI